MIIEGTRRNDEWQQIRKTIPHDGLVLRPKTVFSDKKLNLKLRPTEWRVLSHINGRFTVRAVVNRSTMGNFEVQHILYQFLRDGLIEIAPNAGTNGSGKGEGKSALIPSGEKARSGGILGGFLGKGEKHGRASGHALEFASPLGMLAHFASELFADALASKEYQTATRSFERTLLGQRWMLVSQGYTRADLIDVQGERLTARRMEAALGACDFDDYTEECYQDAWEALISTIRVLHNDLREGLGETVTARILREVMARFDVATVRYHGPFSIKEHLAPLLK